jgi:hypothetical protein
MERERVKRGWRFLRSCGVGVERSVCIRLPIALAGVRANSGIGLDFFFECRASSMDALDQALVHMALANC